MKKLLALLLAVVLVFGLVACGGNTTNEGGENGAPGASTATVKPTTPEEIEAKFGFLVEAYKYGAPPHGGSGMGLDRLAMVMSGADSLRDVLAFPKVQNASELMSGCPAPADAKALADLSIAVIEEE